MHFKQEGIPTIRQGINGNLFFAFSLVMLLNYLNINFDISTITFWVLYTVFTILISIGVKNMGKHLT